MSSVDIYLTPTISVRQAFLTHDVSHRDLDRYIRLIQFCQTIDTEDELTEEHDQLLSEGWIHGMLPRAKPKKFFINKDGKYIRVLPEEIDNYVFNGWKIGMGPKKQKQ